jgi:hypothetical protein
LINYASFLEEGTRLMAARPFIVRSINAALANIERQKASKRNLSKVQSVGAKRQQAAARRRRRR